MNRRATAQALAKCCAFLDQGNDRQAVLWFFHLAKLLGMERYLK